MLQALAIRWYSGKESKSARRFISFQPVFVSGLCHCCHIFMSIEVTIRNSSLYCFLLNEVHCIILFCTMIYPTVSERKFCWFVGTSHQTGFVTCMVSFPQCSCQRAPSTALCKGPGTALQVQHHILLSACSWLWAHCILNTGHSPPSMHILEFPVVVICYTFCSVRVFKDPAFKIQQHLVAIK